MVPQAVNGVVRREARKGAARRSRPLKNQVLGTTVVIVSEEKETTEETTRRLRSN